jgi:hypothetical protein
MQTHTVGRGDPVFRVVEPAVCRCSGQLTVGKIDQTLLSQVQSQAEEAVDTGCRDGEGEEHAAHSGPNRIACCRRVSVGAGNARE